MQPLYTKEGRALPVIPWNRYPRPQMVRKDWQNLNGLWSFRAGEGAEVPILVPFCPESLLSGVENPPESGERLFYSRRFRIPEAWQGRRVLLHFGAVSRDCTVALNGRELCRHETGYLPFTADLTEALQEGENELSLRVVNDLSEQYPRGKQSTKRGGMWYTPCSGIWQSVWLESVPDRYIRALHIRTSGSQAEIEAEGVTEGVVRFEGREIPLQGGKAVITVSRPHLWSPEDPYLYRFSVVSGEDAVSSYFALRTLEREKVNGIWRLLLNGKPYFFHGLLDQGYWSDGLYTPSSPELYEKDILAMKALGFNTLRKHIKIEPEQFYYDCDRLGMIVFQDMVSSGSYSYLRDTLLPTAGLKRRSDLRLNRDEKYRSVFLACMDETVRTLGNHPCVAMWTIFNEGWGQFCADEAFRRLKALDPDRFINSTSGWFHQRESDVEGSHIYFQKQHLGREDRAQLITEFGGYVWKVPEHSFNLEKTYGYRKYPDRESFVAGIHALYEEEVLPLVPKGLCGTVYTQVSDVEDETNGLLTFDREVQKLQPEEFRDIAKKLQKAVYSR